MSNKTDDDSRVDGWTSGNFDIADAFDMAQELARDIAQITRSEPRLPFPAAPFNYEGALHDIFAKEDEITQLARAFNDADEKRKKAKLALDQAHEQLSAMIAVIRVREEERRDEPTLTIALDGRDLANAIIPFVPEPLTEYRRVVLALAQREMVMPRELIESWSPEERAAVIAWARFDDPGQAPPPLPVVLASSHMAGIDIAPQYCTECGAVLMDGDDETTYYRAGWFVGTGCPGKPKAPEPEPAPRRRKRDA